MRTKSTVAIVVVGLALILSVSSLLSKPPVPRAVTMWDPDILVAHYPLDGNANDVGPCQNHGTVHGAVPTSDRFGNPTGAYYFDGTSAYIEVPDHPCLQFGTGDFTISLWAKIVPTPGRGSYFVQKGGTGGGCTAWSVNEEIDGTPHLHFENGWGTFCSVSSVTSLWAADRWYHVVAVKRGGTLEMYIDGSPERSASCSTPTADTDMPIYIGARSDFVSYAYAYGSLDDIRIYNRALTGDEIAGLFRMQ